MNKQTHLHLEWTESEYIFYFDVIYTYYTKIHYTIHPNFYVKLVIFNTI